MPDSVFTYRMPAGIPGDITRFATVGTTVEAQAVNQTAANAGALLSPPSWTYGNAVIVDANGARPIVAADATPSPINFGVLVRPFPGGDRLGVFPGPGTTAFGNAGVPTSGIVDVMRRGYITVHLGGAAAAIKGAPVYLYFNASNGLHIQGGFEAAAGAGAVILPFAYFIGPADAQGNTEIALSVP